MRFDGSCSDSSPPVPEGGRQLSDEWQLIAKFLLREDTKVFRLACKQINTELYNKLTVFSEQFKKRPANTESSGSQGFKREHCAPSEVEEIKQSGLAKVRNLVNNLTKEK